MANQSWTTVVAMSLVIAVALSFAAPRPAQAGDLGKILAGAAVGYLVYTALDNASSRSEVYRQYDPPRRGEQYPRSGPNPREVYDEGYSDGWQDGERYGHREGYREVERDGYQRGWQEGERYGYREGWGDGYRVGERDGRRFPRGSSYRPPPSGWHSSW